ncbi:hypothetical protein M9980_06515 [Sphingomonas donggukensis]|uniref:Lipoprotein n=1 Tax=Sphingomonas donggukensis TaxID=2949093 RepID=A0ABY4TZ59_9SPHN|nr:hypothetical protein [Sphingomonas donggukensis]URW76842.1 hypothetical protein M9980_06515 [Sphingomonas donggukensis]
MIRRGLAIAALVLLASCPRQGPIAAVLVAPDLETAAIARGLVADPADRDIVGLYARDTDRVCVVRRGLGYRIGAHVDYGQGVACSGAGSVSRSGDTLRVTLGEGCAFYARFDGARIVFPASVPEACAQLCGRRASFEALEVDRLSESEAEARAMRTAGNELPCAVE